MQILRAIAKNIAFFFFAALKKCELKKDRNYFILKFVLKETLM